MHSSGVIALVAVAEGMLDSSLVAKMENVLIGGYVCTENVDKTGKITLLSETTAKNFRCSASKKYI